MRRCPLPDPLLSPGGGGVAALGPYLFTVQVSASTSAALSRSSARTST